jgi:AMMECR1 domain-containing protein
MTALAPLAAEDRAALLALARAALLHRLGLGPAPTPPGEGPLALPRAAFLTVAAEGEPRAALGSLAPAGPLGEAVIRLGARAVDGDPRTFALTAADLPSLSFHLAVLGPMQPLPAGELPSPGVHGVAVQQGWHRGLLLPSAAAPKGWDAAQLLKHACLAAGLSARAPLEPETVVEVFEAEEFGEC